MEKARIAQLKRRLKGGITVAVILIVAMILKKFINNRYVNGALKGVRPIVLSLILSTAILLFIKVIFFTSGSINYEQVGFSKELFALFVMLGGFMIIYKKIKKKSINPLLILLLSAIFGVIVFI